MKLQAVKFDGEWFVLLKEKNHNGVKFTSLRRVQGTSGSEYIRHKGKNIDVSDIVRNALEG